MLTQTLVSRRFGASVQVAKTIPEAPCGGLKGWRVSRASACMRGSWGGSGAGESRIFIGNLAATVRPAWPTILLNG